MPRTLWFGNGRTASAGHRLHLEPLEDRTAPATLTVTNTNDAGPGSLREAIGIAANVDHPGLDTIAFNIPGGGVRTISPASPLPTITEPLFIDGYSQPGSATNTNGPGLGSNALPLIELDGSAAGAFSTGLAITGGGSTVRGLVINRFGNQQIALSGLGGNGIAGNFIGTNATGTANFPTAGGNIGVYVNDVPNNVIGGTTPAARNVISTNRGTDVSIAGVNAAGNRVEGNLIGTDAAGTTALRSNNPAGVRVDNAPGNVIGGTAAGAGNVVSIFDGLGIGLAGPTATGNRVEGNRIGTDVTGTARLGNLHGVSLSVGASGNIIGGPATTPGLAPGNLIAGNNFGVVFNDAATTGNRVQGNVIGRPDPAAVSLNNNYGVYVNTGVTGNAIGGVEAGEGNAIGFNVFSGVVLTATAGNGNALLGNAIYSNGTLGIDLGDNGLTANDPGDADAGANRLQNFPVLSAASQSGSTLSITYTVPTALANATYPIRVEFFRADTDGQEGQTFLGADTFTDANFTAGSKSVSFGLAAALPNGTKVVASATDAGGNTSEFSTAFDLPTGVLAITTVEIVVAPNPSVLGQPVTLLVTTTAVDSVFADGIVDLKEGNTVLASLPLNTQGTATFSIASLGLGSHAVHAVYRGSATFVGRASPIYMLTVRLARTDTWDGGGADEKWTTAANWVGDMPAAPGDALVFPAGAARRANLNDFPAGSLFTNITFTGGDYSIGGNGIALGGNLNDLWSGPAATAVLALDIALTRALQFLTVKGPDTVLQLDGRVSGFGGLVKSGRGALILGGDNSYNGSTLINQGVVGIRTATALGGSATGTTVNGLGVLQVVGVNELVMEPLALAGRLEGRSSSGWSGSIGLSGSAATVDVAPSLTILPEAPLPFALTSTVSGAGNLNKTGAGTLVLSGNNTYGGATFIRQGTVSVRHFKALGKPSRGTQVNAGATLEVQGGLPVNEPLLLGGTLHSAGGDNTWKGTVDLSSDAIMKVDADQLVIDAVISNAPIQFNTPPEIEKRGDGYLVFTRANLYTGVTDVQEGVLKITHFAALGTSVWSRGTTVRDGAALEIEGIAGPLTIIENLTLSGTGVDNRGALRSVFGSNTWSRPITLDGEVYIGVEVSTPQQVFTIAGNVLGTSTEGLGKVGPGYLRLDGTAAFDAPISVIDGVLDFDRPNNLGSSFSGTTVYGGARLRYSGPSLAIVEPITLMANAVVEVAGPCDWTGAWTLAGTATVVTNQPVGALSLGSVSGVDGARLQHAGPGLLNLRGEYAVTLSGSGANGLNQIEALGGSLSLQAANKLYPAAVLDLSLAAGFTPPIFASFTIINNRTASPVSGFFSGLREGTVFAVSVWTFRISYQGGDGNDVVLTRIA